MLDYPLTLPNAGKLKSDVIKTLEGQKTVVLDLARFERINMACLQVLVATHKYAQDRNVPCKIYISDSVYALVSAMGLDMYFTAKGSD